MRKPSLEQCIPIACIPGLIGWIAILCFTGPSDEFATAFLWIYVLSIFVIGMIVATIIKVVQIVKAK